MRDPDRIKPFLEKVEKVWKTVPDWRFGQLVENFKRMAGESDLFFIEDSEFLEKLYQIFEEEPKEENI